MTLRCLFATNYVIIVIIDFFNLTKEILLKCDIYVSCPLISSFNLGFCISTLDAPSKYILETTNTVIFLKKLVTVERTGSVVKEYNCGEALSKKHFHQEKTYPRNVYPLKPNFSIVKMGFAGVYLFFLFLIQNIICMYSLEPPQQGGSNVYPQSMFWAEILKILLIKFSILRLEISLYIVLASFRNDSFRPNVV